MKKAKTLLASIGLAALVATPLSAEGKQEKPAAAEKVTVKIVSTFLRENYDKDIRVKAFYDSVEEFNKANPNSEIQVEALAHDAYQDKVQILAAANQLPDIYDLKGSWARNYVRNGHALGLKQFIDADPEWKALIKETAYGNFLVDGDIYGLCMDAGGSTSLVFYNKEIFKKLGYSSFPKTIPELFEVVKKAKAAGYTPISLGNMAQWPAESCYFSVIGARHTGNDWNASIVNRTGAKFTDKAWIDALAAFKAFADTGAFNADMNSIDYKEQRIPYYDGRAAMFVEGYWAIPALLKDAPEAVRDATGIARLPAFPGAKGDQTYISGGNGGWAIALNPKLAGAKRDAAVAWFKYFHSKKFAAMINEKGITTGIAAGNDVNLGGLHPVYREYFALVDSSKPCDVYDLIFDQAYEKPIEAGIQELLAGMVSPEELAKRVQAAYEKYK